MYELKNWSIGPANPFVAPEVVSYIAFGNVFDNPRFKNGTYIHTSKIMKIVHCDDYKEIHTRNSVYIVRPENVDPDYEREYPNAFKRLKMEVME